MTHEEYEKLAALEPLGGLSSEEAAALEYHAGDCLSCGAELEENRRAAALVLLAAPPVSPAAHLRRRIIAPTATVSDRMRRLSWLVAACSAGILLLAAGWAVSAYRARTAIHDVQRELALVEAESVRNQRVMGELERRLSTITGADRSFRLAGQSVAPAASARVFVNEHDRSATILFTGLPPNPPGTSYQMWIIRGDRAEPQSAGTFDAGSDGTAQIRVEDLPVDTEMKACAVTLEPEGGARSPTGAKVLFGS